MDGLVRLAASAGLPEGSLRFLAALFAAPLLCALHGALPGAALRHAASAALGAAMCLFVYGVDGSARLAPPVVACALIMALTPRRAGPITFALTFAYLHWWCAARTRCLRFAGPRSRATDPASRPGASRGSPVSPLQALRLAWRAAAQPCGVGERRRVERGPHRLHRRAKRAKRSRCVFE